MSIKKIITPRWGDIPISKHKSFEYQFEDSSFLNDNIIEFQINWSRKRDHAGISFTFGIYKLFWMNLNIHDHRHWDRDNDCWVKYPD